MDCVASTVHTTSEHGLSSITTADAHTSAELTHPPADFNGLVRFDERRNLVSVRVLSHFKRGLRQNVNGASKICLCLCLCLQGDGEGGDGGGSNILSLLGPLSGSLSGVRISC